MAHYASQGREPSLMGKCVELMIRRLDSGRGPATNYQLIHRA